MEVKSNRKKVSKKKIFLALFFVIFVLIAVIWYFRGGIIKVRSAIEVKQLNEHIWLLNDNNVSTGFLVVGKEKAAVIDTMNGKEDVQALVRKITDLPLVVINTHGHNDHIYGNAYFEQVYIHPDDLPLAYESYSYPMYKYIEMRYGLEEVNFLEMKEGDIFELGGVSLEVYKIPGHTAGGVCILDREDRVLFTGDSINRHCWMQLDSGLPMEVFYQNLLSLQDIRDKYDYILHGHTQDFDDASLYEEMLAAVKEVSEGNREGDTQYTYFGGTCMQHPFPSGGGVIVYNP